MRSLALLIAPGLFYARLAFAQEEESTDVSGSGSGSGSGSIEDMFNDLSDEIAAPLEGDIDVEELLEEGSSLVTEEDSMDEFFAGIKDDLMMQQVISDMNGLEGAIQREKLTRGGNVSDLAEETLAAMKRFADLKKLVSFLQPKDKRISRYCFYGCWCLPEGAHGFVAGRGPPVDIVDKVCQQLWYCYTCAKDDFGSCNPNVRRYSYRFFWDVQNKNDYSKRGIVCNNGWRPNYNSKTVKYNCARAICECDRGFAMRLGKYADDWHKSRHRVWSFGWAAKKCEDNLWFNVKTVAYNCPGANCEYRVEAVTNTDVAGVDFTSNPNGAVACPGTYDVAENPNGRKPFYDWEYCQYQNGCQSGQIGSLTDDCGTGPQHELVCCGSYRGGWRKPNKDHGGIRACCSEAQGAGVGLRWFGNMYNSLTQCCVNGAVVTPGGGGPLTCN